MTIVATEDKRNAAWAEDKSSFGRKMLAKMGWSEGKGLGKKQQGQTNNLRAIRREESLGIGASTDTHGSEGFSQTSANFHGVLAKLNAEHGNSSASGNDSGSDSGSSKSDKKKKKKKSKKGSKKDNDKEVAAKKKHRGKRDKDESMSSSRKRKLERKSSGLTLAQNRVAAGHARKMREAKDMSSKSAADMAAVFGVRVEHYQPVGVAVVSNADGDTAKRKSKKDKKSSKKKSKKEKKKRQREEESSSASSSDAEGAVKNTEEKKSKKKKKKSKKAD